MLRAALLVSLCVASALSASPKWRRSVDESNRFMVHGSPRLVGGEPAEANQFPYQVSFQYKFGGHFCGGMVYDENHVITAAHCCTNSASQVKIVAGDHRLSSNDGTEQERDVTEVRQHESYFGSSNDVCMLTLAEPLEYNFAVVAVNMPTQDYEFEVGSKATLSGWGALGSSQSSPDELYFNPNNEVVSDDQCQHMYNSIGLGSYFVPEDEFCAGLDGDSACYGDSGGPLVCEEDRKLCGVVSWGYDCNTNVAPAVYAQAAHYVDWFTTNSK